MPIIVPWHARPPPVEGVTPDQGHREFSNGNKAGTKTILEPLSAGTQVAESECLQMEKNTAFSSSVNLQSSQSMLYSPCLAIACIQFYMILLCTAESMWQMRTRTRCLLCTSSVRIPPYIIKLASMVYFYPENRDPTDFGTGPPEGLIRPCRS